jgi:hypothetical protein
MVLYDPQTPKWGLKDIVSEFSRNEIGLLIALFSTHLRVWGRYYSNYKQLKYLQIKC